MATDPTLSAYEKIGFPDHYRAGYERAIFDDIVAKLPQLDQRDLVVLDIGTGCTELPGMIIERCRRQGHTLLLCDSEQMLAHHPDGDTIRKFAGRFPDCPDLCREYVGRVDAILAYSVLHYVHPHASVDEFLDATTRLLAHGGRLLIGDIPNGSKRRRFLTSPAGEAFHRAFTGSDEPPEIPDETVPGKIDDRLLMGLVARARATGFDAYLIPQPDALPMANRREDLLVYRP